MKTPCRTPAPFRAALLCAIAAAWPQPASAQSDTTTIAQILADTVAAAPSCTAWRVSGTCFWLKCTMFGCSVKTSVRVSHYNPDAVVSTFHDEDTHPWSDWGAPIAQSLRGTAAALVGMPVDSAGTRTRDDRRDRAKMFRDADLIGHPASLLSLLGGSGTFGMLCPTEVDALKPYFSSYVDALAWRALLPVEALYPATLTPGLREIGSWPLNSWGAVYPRDGNVTQQHPVKAAAVLAQRVGDITTRSEQPHVYLRLPTGGRKLVGNTMLWRPPPLVERDGRTGRWQMLAPKPQASCEVFGANDTVSPVSWGDGRTSQTGGYAFNLWRPYSCCQRAGQWFLGAVTY